MFITQFKSLSLTNEMCKQIGVNILHLFVLNIRTIGWPRLYNIYKCGFLGFRPKYVYLSQPAVIVFDIVIQKCTHIPEAKFTCAQSVLYIFVLVELSSWY